MQYERGEGAGKEDFPILGDCRQQNIDTGMGMERMAVLLQGVDNIYEIDRCGGCSTGGRADRAEVRPRPPH